MGPKSQKREKFQEEEILQAVLIADSFNVRFAPISKSVPRALMPLANVPLLDYTLEFLGGAGIQEVFVYCCAHADKIKAHIRDSKWGSSTSSMFVQVIISEDSLSIGDVLRDIDGKSLIRSDFVLVNGDLISNMQLKPIIEKHKKIRESDKSSVMTLVFTKAPPYHHSRCKEDEVIIAANQQDDKILHFRRMTGRRQIEFPIEIFKENSNVQLLYDLLDSNIAICSSVVPPLFSDNFDYSTRDHFVKGILDNEEILGNTMYLHVVENEYAVRVSNLIMYDSVSQDVLSRWAYPLVPDNNVSSQHCDGYICSRHNVYLNKDVTLARGCVLEENVIIGPGTTICANSKITHSVIGRNCKIGENVKLNGAYIWDNCVIDDDCNITSALICNNANVKRGVTIEPGCILSFGVILGPGVTLKSRTSLVSEPVEYDDDTELPTRARTIDPEFIGMDGKAYLYVPPASSDDEDENFNVDIWGLKSESDDEVSDEESEVEVESDEDGDQFANDLEDDDDDSKLFYREMLDTMARSIEEDLSPDNMILEINSLKHAYNITIKEVNQLILQAMVEYSMLGNQNMEATALLAAIIPLLKKWKSVLLNYIKTGESQMESLKFLEDFSLTRTNVTAAFMKIIHFLYDSDVLSEEAILHWYKSVPAGAERSQRQALRKTVVPFIKWLEEADEESEDDDDD